MASIHREVRIERGVDEVWDAVRDWGAPHKRLAPGFLLDTRVEGEARVEVHCDGRDYRSRAASTDILEASALALVEVINRIERRRALQAREEVAA